MRGLSLNAPSLVFLRISVAFGHFCRLSHLCRARLFRSGQEWGPPHTVARFGLIGPYLRLAKRWDGGRGVNPGLIWPCLALFTPSGEAGNEARVASFGPPLTRTRWASVASWWLWLASLRVARSDETFKTLSFSLIWSHFLSSEPSSSPSPRGDFCITVLGGRSSSHPPARYACGGHPHTPGSGASLLSLPHSRGYASRLYELRKGLLKGEGICAFAGTRGADHTVSHSLPDSGVRGVNL